jgi:hypothetical protein
MGYRLNALIFFIETAFLDVSRLAKFFLHEPDAVSIVLEQTEDIDPDRK